MNQIGVLVVEDNNDMREAVKSYLRDHGFRVEAYDRAESALKSTDIMKNDIAIIDIALPGDSGIKLTKNLKELGFDGPIIAITARDTVEDKLLGFASGMSDYIVKPFDLRELEARITAQLRERGVVGKSTINTANFRIEPKRHAFFMKNKQIKLTIVEFQIMFKLMQNHYSVVSSADLIEAVWGESAMYENPPLRIHISNLRGKIKDLNLQIIQTIPGVGYMLND